MTAKKKATQEVTIDNIGERTIRRALEFINNPELYLAEMEDQGGNPITLGPRVADPSTWAEDQVLAAKAKGQKWFDNSLKPKKVPSEAALASKGKYRQRLEESLNEKRWEGAMENVDEDLRLEVIKDGGVGAFTGGIDRHKKKVVAKVKVLQPLVLALAKELDGMAVDTDEQREAKMIAAKRGMQAIGKALKGG